MQDLIFNTGRTYTEHGQRIVARRLESGAIAMLDIDRGIDYLLPPSTKLTPADVMRAYDHHEVIFPSDIGLDYSDYYALFAELRAAAASIPSLTT